VVAKWISHYRPDLIPPEWYMVLGLLAVAFVVVSLLGFILQAPSVTSEVLCAGIATFLLMGLLWGIAYTFLARLDPGAFVFNTGPESQKAMKGFEAVYFSFTTMSTVGYGDIVPVSRVARMLAMSQAMVGMFYMTILIARLVSLYSSAKNTQSSARQQENKE